MIVPIVTPHDAFGGQDDQQPVEGQPADHDPELAARADVFARIIGELDGEVVPVGEEHDGRSAGCRGSAEVQRVEEPKGEHQEERRARPDGLADPAEDAASAGPGGGQLGRDERRRDEEQDGAQDVVRHGTEPVERHLDVVADAGEHGDVHHGQRHHAHRGRFGGPGESDLRIRSAVRLRRIVRNSRNGL